MLGFNYVGQGSFKENLQSGYFLAIKCTHCLEVSGFWVAHKMTAVYLKVYYICIVLYINFWWCDQIHIAAKYVVLSQFVECNFLAVVFVYWVVLLTGVNLKIFCN